MRKAMIGAYVLIVLMLMNPAVVFICTGVTLNVSTLSSFIPFVVFMGFYWKMWMAIRTRFYSTDVVAVAIVKGEKW